MVLLGNRSKCSAKTAVKGEKLFHFMLAAFPEWKWASGQSSSGDRLEEFHTDQVDVARLLLPFDPRLNGRHTSGNQSRRGDGGRGNGQRHHAAQQQWPRAGDKGSQPTHIQSLGKLNELFTVSISSTDKQRDLEMNALKSPALFCQRLYPEILVDQLFSRTHRYLSISTSSCVAIH